MGKNMAKANYFGTDAHFLGKEMSSYLTTLAETHPNIRIEVGNFEFSVIELF